MLFLKKKLKNAKKVLTRAQEEDIIPNKKATKPDGKYP